MKLDYINLNELKLSPLNVRKKGGKDFADLLPSIRSIGIHPAAAGPEKLRRF